MKAPPVTLTAGGLLALAGLAVLGVAGVWLYTKRGAIAAAAGEAVGLVNPADDRNLVNRGVSAVGEAVTGREGWTLGGQIADWFPSAAERELGRQLRPSTSPATSEPEPYGLPPYYAP